MPLSNIVRVSHHITYFGMAILIQRESQQHRNTFLIFLPVL
ncbi:hypothetical protein T01_3838 [Trichinella spiralis]|uniref:Uncharacterized protein n=1 Tax=Trichinella spiralis TaxID=6334 RepID=A0A0V1ANL1_TRISP|nr:hypothetical protein T01_2985 [Trichinella spiralis]KRY26121.1 hypothetical protein T01_3838 [Trichinella spiralis]